MSLITLLNNIFWLRQIKGSAACDDSPALRHADKTLGLRPCLNSILSLLHGFVTISTRYTRRELSSCRCVPRLLRPGLGRFEYGGLLFVILLVDEGVHAVLLDVLLEVPMQLVDVGVLLEAGHLGDIRIVEVADVVLLNLQLLELPLDL